MGRKRSVNLSDPPRLRRKGKAYYYDHGGKPRRWEPLGTDYLEALRRYADIEGQPAKLPDTFAAVAQRFAEAKLLQVAAKTRREYEAGLARLRLVFDPVPVANITPADVRRYMDLRPPVAATREKALLSTLINWARERGMVDCPNPCAGIRGVKAKRTRYVEDAEFQAVRDEAPEWLQDVLDLLLLVPHNPQDVLRLRRTDVREGALHVRRGKTGEPVAIEVEGELAALLERLQAPRQGEPASVFLLHRRGTPATYWQVRAAFEKARQKALETGALAVSWQLRDLRAKAASEVELGHAQALLGHATQATTEIYRRKRRGVKVKPAR
jgi:integrase